MSKKIYEYTSLVIENKIPRKSILPKKISEYIDFFKERRILRDVLPHIPKEK